MFLLGWSLLSALLCVVNLHWYVFWHLVVLVKLSVLVKWLARKTPLRKSICADGIIFPGRRVFMNFMIVSFHYLIIWCVGLDIFYTPLSPFYRPFSRSTLVSRYQNVSVLDFIGAKDDGGGDDNGSCKMCEAPVKSSPTNQQPTVDKLHVLPVAQPTVSKHWREIPASCYLYLRIALSNSHTREYISLYYGTIYYPLYQLSFVLYTWNDLSHRRPALMALTFPAAYHNRNVIFFS